MSSPPEFERLRLLLLQGKAHTLAKASVVQTSGVEEVLDFISSGFIKRYFIAHDGSLGVQVVYGPGDIFPLTVVYKGLFDLDIYQGPEAYYYETMTPVKMYSLNVKILAEKAKAEPLIYRDLLKYTGQRLNSNIQFLENLNLRNAYCKTAHQLVYFGRRFGEETPQGIRLTLPLAHQDLADILGTTRETVTFSIIKLRDKQLIKTDHHRFVLLDMDKLITEAYS